MLSHSHSQHPAPSSTARARSARRPRLAHLGALGLAAAALLAGPIACADELKEGDNAPSFSTRGDDGKAYALADFKGKTVVLYFYPKDDTPGCTVEAKEFRDDFEKFKAKGAIVLGVSLDTSESHAAFRQKHQLNFPLLVGGEAIAKAYGVRTLGGYASRQTFIIDKTGKLKKIFRSVTPKGHSAEILGLI